MSRHLPVLRVTGSDAEHLLVSFKLIPRLAGRMESQMRPLQVINCQVSQKKYNKHHTSSHHLLNPPFRAPRSVGWNPVTSRRHQYGPWLGIMAVMPVVPSSPSPPLGSRHPTEPTHDHPLGLKTVPRFAGIGS